MPQRVWRVLGALLGALLAAALLGPTPDREALLAQGVGRLLGADLDAAPARGASGWPPGSPFRAVEALSSAAKPDAVTGRLRIDGRPGRSAAIERAVRAQWNRYRPAAGLPPLRFGEGPVPERALALQLDVTTSGGRLALAGYVARGFSTRQFRARADSPLPGRASLLPALVAILVGLAFGRTLLALFLGVYAGAVLLAIPEGASAAPLRGVAVFATLLVRELRDDFRLEIVGFIVALIGMVGVVTRAGGLQGLVDRFVRVTHTARRAQLAAAGLGLLLFFDDYANCVLVGSTMRPLTDRLRVSREKLAWIVDSTAAPVASLSLLSTWIAFQVSVFAPQLPSAGITESGYAVFLATLPYRFYCGLTLLFVFSAILAGRDFGPMARAERRARTTGALVRPGRRPPAGEAAYRILPEPGMPHDWRIAAAPIALTMAVTLAWLFAEGGGFTRLADDPTSLLTLPGLGSVLVPGGGSASLLAGALAGLWLAFFLGADDRFRIALVAGGALALAGPALAPALPDGGRTGMRVALFAAGLGLGAWGGRRLQGRTRRPFVPTRRLFGAALASAPTLGFAVVLLFLAWMIGAVCRELHTADYLVALLSGTLPAGLLPLLLFSLSGLVAFATGSSWSTLSILVPNVVGLAASAGVESPLGAEAMVALCIAAVLEGAVFGDHCSPISDTTVLSSVASGSDHLDHVRTQGPYALLVAGVSAGVGYLPLLLFPRWSPWAGFGLGALLLWAVLWLVGRPSSGADRALAQPEFLQ